MNGKHIVWGHSYPALNSALQERDTLDFGGGQFATIDPGHIVINYENVAFHIDDLVVSMLRRAQRMVEAAASQKEGVEAINTLITKYKDEAARSTQVPEYATHDRKRPPKRDVAGTRDAIIEKGEPWSLPQDDEIVVRID